MICSVRSPCELSDHIFVNGAGFSKQVKQKVTERRLAVGGLEEEVEYRFSVRGVTEGGGAGAAAQARARTGPQRGSPAAVRALQLQPEPAALRLRWLNAAPGTAPLKGYYFEARRKGTYHFTRSVLLEKHQS